MNDAYLARMKSMLGDEYSAYLQSFEEPANRGIRINTLKRTNAPIDGICGRKSPFAENGWYLDAACNVGQTPEYLCGHIYPQEPSASFAVTAMDLKPGMRVLDLCAAPGSKSTQIAEALDHQGLLVANEIISSRAAILKENMERCGAANVIIVNNTPAEVAKAFPEYFDAVLCDAPCSGEGMFRKDPDAVTHWSPEHVSSCAARQSGILDDSAACVKPGGVLVYSTCTFSIEENEQNVISFLKRHPEFIAEPISAEGGRPGIMMGQGAEYTRRIYPMDGGEGHFVARFRKCGEPAEITLPLMTSAPVPKEITAFLNENLTEQFPYLYVHNEVVYGGTAPFIVCRGLHLIRHQTMIGTIRRGRFEPSHGLAMSSWTAMKQSVELSEEEYQSYRRGNTIARRGIKGWAAVTVKGMQAGLAKGDGTILKNHYPKAFRIR